MFETSRRALSFALNHTRTIYAQPLMTKYANLLTIKEGRDPYVDREALSALDQAAQAGLIYIQFAKLPAHQAQVLIARASIHATPCACRSPCCMGMRPNPEWTEAIKWVSNYVLHEMNVQQAKKRKKTVIPPLLRRNLVEKFFGIKYHGADLAEKFDLTENTITNYKKPVFGILNGVEKDGWTALDNILTNAGIVGNPAENQESL